jgi:hypothetical protein
MQQSKLLGVLTSRKAWAAIIGIGLTLGIDYFQGVDPEWIVGAITLIVGVYTGSVALEDGLTGLATGLQDIRDWWNRREFPQ